MKITKYTLIALACLTTIAGAQQSESPYLRTLRAQQERQAEVRRQQDEANQRYLDTLNRQKEERLQRQRDADAAAKRRSDDLIADINRQKEERLQKQREAEQRAKDEAARLNESNRIRRAKSEKTSTSDREPEVVQRREIGRKLTYDGPGHGQNTRIRTYDVTYRIVWDNGTSTTETVSESQ
jgi:hypothetical protein